MLAIILLLGVALWIAWPYLADRRTDRREDARLMEKVEMRRSALARAPESASAQEALGDALRDAGRLDEAIACYQKAQEMETRAGQAGDTIAAALGGTGLENKLRVSRLEAAEQAQTVYGNTLATRQQVCRRCGALNEPSERACTTCGDLLPVDSVLDTVRGDAMRGQIVRESIELVTMVFVVLVALLITSILPLEVKGVLGVSATGVLLWRFLRRIGGN